MTFGAMLSDLYRKLNFGTSPDTVVATRLTAFLNETLQEMVSEVGMQYIADNPAPITFASVASQTAYTLALPTNARIRGITERTNDRKLTSRTMDWYRSVDPDAASHTGVPECWIPMGFTGASSQPTAACKIYVDSSDAGDVGTAYIEVLRTGGLYGAASATMTGTTEKQVGAFADVTHLLKCYLSAAAVGDVIFTEGSAGATISTIPIGGTHARYWQFALWPTPAAVVTYYADTERDLPAMSNATDEPPFPERFHRVLVEGAYARELEKENNPLYTQARTRYERGKRQMKAGLWYPPDADTGPVGISRLGSYTPIDTIVVR